MRAKGLLLALVLLLLLAACGGDAGEQAADDGDTGEAADADGEDVADGEMSGETVRISVGIDAAYAPMFVAEDQGMFEDLGVDVELVQFAQGGEGIDAMIAGEIHMGGSGDATVIGKSVQGDLRALVIFQESGDYLKLVVREGIDDAADIARFGIVPGSLSEYGATRLLSYLDVPEDDVEFIPAGPPELPPLLERGEIDGFVIWEPWPTTAEELGGQVLMRTKEFDYAYVQFIVANGQWLEEHEAEARAVVEAILQACEFVEANPDETAEIVQAAVDQPPEQTLQAIEQIDFGVREINEDDVANFEDISAFLVDREIAPSDPDLDRLVESGWTS